MHTQTQTQTGPDTHSHTHTLTHTDTHAQTLRRCVDTHTRTHTSVLRNTGKGHKCFLLAFHGVLLSFPLSALQYVSQQICQPSPLTVRTQRVHHAPHH